MLLALDTSLSSCSTALMSRQGIFIDQRHIDLSKGHAEHLIPMIEDMMSASNTTMQEITAVVSTIGPGSFTGLRTGLAAARGYGVALNVPVFGVTTLEALALTAIKTSCIDHPMMVTIDARRGQVYVQKFSPEGTPLTDQKIENISDLLSNLPQEKLTLLGSGAPLIADACPGANLLEITTPRASAFIHIALHRPRPLTPPQALYLRAPDAKLPGGIIPPGFE